ncbi:MAG: DUF481 domain-containing protein [Planctomycetota bacterium]
MSFSMDRLLVAGLALGAAAAFTASVTAEQVELTSGDTLTGEIVSETDESLVMDHPVLGRVTIAKDQIKQPEAPLEPTTMAEQSAQMFADFVDSWFFPGWDKSVAAGFSGTEGNSETFNIYASVATGFEDEEDRWKFDANYFRNSTDGEVTQNQFRAVLFKDWLLPESDLFYWAQGTAQFDQFTDYETRLGGFAGVGYALIDDDVNQLLLRAGAGGQYEFGDVNEFTPEALLGVDWKWIISETQTVTLFNYLYPALDPAFSEFRNLSGAMYEVELAAGDGLKLRLGVENEFVSDVDEGFDESDFKYFGALAFDF